MTTIPQTAPTAPGYIPLLGHALRLAHPKRLGYVQALRAHGPVVKILIGPREVYVLNSPAALQQMLLAPSGTFTKGMLFDRTRPFFGNGILSSNGPFHRRQRRMIQPAFHKQRITEYFDRMSALAAKHIGAWAPDTPFTADHRMRETATQLISHTLFTSQAATRMAAVVARALPVITTGVAWRTLAPADFLYRIPLPANRRFDTLCAELRETTQELIRSHQAEGTDQADLVSLLLSARDTDGLPMSEEELRDEIITIFTAGVETAATTLAWACHILTTRPELTNQLRAEADDVLGDRPIAYSDLERLRLTGAFINEILRAFHPTWLLMRRTTGPVVLDGVAIPAQAEILYSPTTLHRDPLLYPDPDRFDPDRWLDGRTDTLPRCAYIPFSAGNRQCIGDSFAIAELHIVLTTLLRRWLIEPVPGRRARETAHAVLYPRNLAVTVIAPPPR
ncbi:cytochrome P450 [Kitasatospora sp. NPDC096077]|uniref:cytochrome P450 n=1 Tax=Kitasatospora sp. NPDC096077 TaxID=3155544 RepID=UPI00332FA563